MKFFNACRSAYRTNPRQVDHVIYCIRHTPTTLQICQPLLRTKTMRHRAEASSEALGDADHGEARRPSNGVAWGWMARQLLQLLRHPLGRSTPAGDLLGVLDLATIKTTMTATPPTATAKRKGSKWDMVGTGDVEIYMFSCVTVVIWSMTEKRFL